MRYILVWQGFTKEFARRDHAIRYADIRGWENYEIREVAA